MEMEFENRIVGYAYVKDQRMEKVYQPARALAVGTVFPELNIPIGEYERGFNCDD